jgi:hypothetical protein
MLGGSKWLIGANNKLIVIEIIHVTRLLWLLLTLILANCFLLALLVIRLYLSCTARYRHGFYTASLHRC